ncbi:MAG: dihydropteroate synthase [Ardenticatenaceae bacterium]|nr:dihydropteroate synthase [Ardenticatenaceae bacterium]
MLVVGESINSTIRRVGEAINNRDAAFIAELAREQVAAGAAMLDVNAGVADGDEAENLLWAIRTVQEAVDVPLVIDSTAPKAVEAALEVHRGRPVLNSISGEVRKLQSLLPLVAESGCGVILLCLDDRGVPKTAAERCAVAQSLVEQAVSANVALEDLYIDPLVLTVGSDWQAARVALEALHLIRAALPQVRTIAGVSNVSFGMPQRSLLNRTFLAMAVAFGLDTVMVNVRDKALTATLWAANALAGSDTYCSDYLDAYHEGKLTV